MLEQMLALSPAPLPRAAGMVAAGRPDLPAGSAQAPPRRSAAQFGNTIALDVLPQWHWARASGVAGVVPRHRGVRRQPEGVPRRRPGAPPGMVAKSRHRARHDPLPGFSAFHGARIAVAAGGGCDCSAAGAARRRPQPRMPGRLRHGCPHQRGTCLRVRARSAAPAASRPGLPPLLRLNERGQSMACPAVLIRAGRHGPALESWLCRFVPHAPASSRAKRSNLRLQRRSGRFRAVMQDRQRRG